MFTNIQGITIPSIIVELGDGWCNNASKLKKINLMPNNPHYTTAKKS